MKHDRPWIRMDARGARTRAIGPTRGIAPAVERRWRLRVVRARDEVRQAHAGGILPHGRWWQDGPVEPHPVTLPLLVLGEPGATNAATLGIPPAAEVDTSSWAMGGRGEFGGMTVRVDGPPHLPGSADPDEDLRFGAFGPVAAGIRGAVLGDQLAGEVEDVIQIASAWCGEVQDDPAVPLATALCPPAFDASPVLVLSSPELLPFARWWSRMTTAITCKPATDGPSHVPRGLAVQVAELGDEAALQNAIYADPPPWVLLLTADTCSADVAAVRSAVSELVQRAGYPVLEMRLLDALPTTLLGAAWVCLEAALATAVAIGVEPLTLIPGEDLRSRLDSGGGSPS
jgi:hypothetical protein